MVITFLVSGDEIIDRVTNAPTDDAIKVPIIMYHSILKEKNRQGQYVIDPADLEADFKNIKEMGFNAIVMKDLLDYVYRGIPLPEKPIMITFDDGNYNNYVYAFPLAKKYDVKFILSPIAYYVDKYTDEPDLSPAYATCSWDTIKEMIDSGYVEMQNHSYNLHSTSNGRMGVRQKKSEDEAYYKTMLTEDIMKAQNAFKENTSWTPTAFTYPFGAYSTLTEDIIKELGFKGTFSCETRTNAITRDPTCLFGLGRYIRTNKDNSKEFLRKIENSLK